MSLALLQFSVLLKQLQPFESVQSLDNLNCVADKGILTFLKLLSKSEWKHFLIGAVLCCNLHTLVVWSYSVQSTWAVHYDCIAVDGNKR